jgi:hypothetical protein
MMTEAARKAAKNHERAPYARGEVNSIAGVKSSRAAAESARARDPMRPERKKVRRGSESRQIHGVPDHRDQ